jgi:hypothetical protein
MAMKRFWCRWSAAKAAVPADNVVMPPPAKGVASPRPRRACERRPCLPRQASRRRSVWANGCTHDIYSIIICGRSYGSDSRAGFFAISGNGASNSNVQNKR